MKNNNKNFKTIQADNLELNIYNAEESSFGVTSVIVSGENDAILIDAQFTLSDAKNVVEKLKMTGKKLTAIFITHGDPDFYFGLEVIKQSFPDTIVYATKETVEYIKATSQKKLDVWGPKLGENGTKNIILPQIIKKNRLELEGKVLEITGTEESPEKTFIWIPSIKTIIGGINIFGTRFHLWMADAQSQAERKQWIDILTKIESLQPSIIIPAHKRDDSELNISSLKYTKEYIISYETVLSHAKTSGELITKMKELYPNATFGAALELGSKVNTGEMKW